MRWLPILGAFPASPTDRLFLVLTLLSVGIVLLLAVLTLTYCIRYRAGSNANRRTPVRTMPTEVLCIGSTFAVFLGLAAWSNAEFVRDRAAPANAYTVYVTAKQWMWKLEHPSGRREIDELHVPAGEPVKLILSSNDVIHSFFVPDLRVKQDVVPGRYTSLWFVASEPGEHHLFCSQYCGTEHSGMTGRVIVMPPGEFSRWLSDRPASEKTPGMPGTPQAPLSRGQAIFYRVGCSACHVQTSNVLAPRLDGLWGRPTKLNTGREVTVDENYIRESILDPNAKIAAGYASPSLMPSFAGRLTDQELTELVEFIRSIRYGWPRSPLPARPETP